MELEQLTKKRASYSRWYHERGGKEKVAEQRGYKRKQGPPMSDAERKTKACDYQKRFRQTERGKRYQVLRSIKRRCEGTIEEYDAAYERQEGKCAICGTEAPKYDKGRLVIDHNHATGKFRGLLCANCNSGLGFFQENAEFFNRALAYLAV
jgi:hypothetical protein